MTGRFDGMVAIVTGASRGLGREFARALGAGGASVLVTARSLADLEATAADVIELGGQCEVICGDASDPGLIARAVALTEERFGGVDLLVNNAGVMLVGEVATADPDEWWQAMDTNVRGPLLWTQAVLPGMRSRGHGRIINVSSLAAYGPMPHTSSYGASKAALSQLSTSLAAEVADDGVIVLAYGPTALTDLSRRLFENEVIPLDRRDQFERTFTTESDELMRLSVDLFTFMAAGGADHMSGSYLGQQRGSFDTPASVARMRTPAPQPR
jgi:NAD(P)-dependent dehydrogenase (short-subunit alcohol dehydrogenase family)